MPFGSSSTYYQPGYAPEAIGRSSSPFTSDSGYGSTFQNEPDGTVVSCPSCGSETTSTDSTSSTTSIPGSMPVCKRCFTWWLLALVAVFVIVCSFGNDDDE